MTARVQVLGLPRASAARVRAVARLTAALADLPDRVSSARLASIDDNGPKGGVAVRCGVTVSVAGWGRLHVEERATTPALALTGALAKLERRLDRRRVIERESRRRPKKYFAATRTLADNGKAGG
jgi:ribosome-associated translation inhibitor RaiA